MKNRLKFGLIGCGRVSKRYLEVFRDELADLATVAVVCDLVPKKMSPFASELGATSAGSIGELLAFQPDVVCVLTESGHHADHAIRVLQEGIPVVIEKPVALRIDDAERIAETAARKGLLCAVVKQNRYNPAMRFAKGVMEAGHLGEIVSVGVRVHWSRPQEYYEDGWHGSWALDGGVLAQQAIHHVDALRWIAGPVSAVCATSTRRSNRLEAEDTAAAVIRFASGAVGTLEATTAARPQDYEASLTILGNRGMLKIGGTALNKVEAWESLDSTLRFEDVRLQHSQDVPTGYGLGHGPYLRDIVYCIRNDSTIPPVSVEDATDSLRLLHALYSSADTGKWANIADCPEFLPLGRSHKDGGA